MDTIKQILLLLDNFVSAMYTSLFFATLENINLYAQRSDPSNLG